MRLVDWSAFYRKLPINLVKLFVIYLQNHHKKEDPAIYQNHMRYNHNFQGDLCNQTVSFVKFS